MEASINSVLTEINNSIKSNTSFGSKITTYGLATQLIWGQKVEPKTVPVLNVGNGQGKVLEWDDKETLRIYHRIIGEVEENTDFTGLGNNQSFLLVYPMRLVAIGTRAALTVANYEDNSELMRDVSKAIPRVSSSKEIIIKGIHEAVKPNVYLEEYPDTNQQHLTLDGVAFYIEYTINQRTCYG